MIASNPNPNPNPNPGDAWILGYFMDTWVSLYSGYAYLQHASIRLRILSADTCPFEPWLSAWLSVCRALSGSVGALSGLCRGSVGTLSGLCRLTIVGPLSASVSLCRTNPDSLYACHMSTSVGLSEICRSVGVGLSVSVDELLGSVEGSQRPF